MGAVDGSATLSRRCVSAGSARRWCGVAVSAVHPDGDWMVRTGMSAGMTAGVTGGSQRKSTTPIRRSDPITGRLAVASATATAMETHGRQAWADRRPLTSSSSSCRSDRRSSCSPAMPCIVIPSPTGIVGERVAAAAGGGGLGHAVTGHTNGAAAATSSDPGTRQDMTGHDRAGQDPGSDRLNVGACRVTQGHKRRQIKTLWACLN